MNVLSNEEEKLHQLVKSHQNNLGFHLDLSDDKLTEYDESHNGCDNKFDGKIIIVKENFNIDEK